MPRRALIAVGLIACLLASSPTSASGAESGSQVRSRQGPQARQNEIKQDLRTLRDEVSEASEEEAALLDHLDQVQERRRKLDARVGALNRQVVGAEKEAQTAESTLERVQSDFVRAQTQLALENEALARAHDRLRSRAVAAYVSNPSSNAAELMLQARNLREIAATAGYLSTVVEVQRVAVRRYTERRDATEALRASVEAQKDAAKRQRDVVVNRLSDLEALRAEQEAVRAQVLSDEAEHARLLEEVQRRKSEFEAQIAALRAESATVVALLQALQVGLPSIAGAAAPVPGRLATPVPGTALTSLFGSRLHPIFGTVRMHDGIDFGAPQGSPIRAAAAGTVISAGARGGYGNATIVDHGGGLATLYAHQSELLVAPGMVVAAGQVIGLVGSTGFSTGPHLHFEVRVSGQPVDPLLYLPL